MDDELLSEQEINYINSDNILRLYFNSMLKYTPLDKDTFLKLFDDYKKGDYDARNIIVNSNWKLVISIAIKFKKNDSDFLDLIQEGNMGLIEALDTYDSNRGEFSTYAYYYIRKNIMNYQKINGQNIGLSIYYINQEKAYNKCVNKYMKENGTLPSDQYIADELGCSLEIVNKIKQRLNMSVFSLNETLEEDSTRSYVEVIGFDDSAYEQIIDKLDNVKFLYKVRSIVGELDYYVIYQRYVCNPKKTLEEISNEFGVTRERIRLIEERALNKLKKLIKANISHYESDSYDCNIKPIEPNMILIYMYLKDSLNALDKKVYYLKYLDKSINNDQDILNSLGINEFVYEQINKRLVLRIKNLLKSNGFIKFSKETISRLGTQLYSEGLKQDIDSIDYSLVVNEFGNMSFQDFLNQYEDLFNKLNRKTQNDIKSFFNANDYVNRRYLELEKVLTLIVSGMYKKTEKISLKKLYECYLEFKDEFTLKQQLIFECFIFNKKPHSVYKEQFPGEKRSLYFLLYRLEKCYYQIDRYMEISLSYDNYKLIREKLNEDDINILDSYFGHNTKKLTIVEMAELRNIEYIDMHSLVRGARLRATSVYMEKSRYLTIDKTIYKDYLDNNFISCTDEARKILDLFIRENKSYDEISKLTGLSNYKISNIITELIRRIDFYRYNILDNIIVTKEEMDLYFESTTLNYDENDKKIIRLRYIDNIDSKDIAKNLNINIREITRLVARFNSDLFKFRVSNVQLSDDEIKREVNKHYTENILNDNERFVISYAYGIKNDCNPNGELLTSAQIQKRFNISVGNYCRYLNVGLRKIRGVKKGLIHADNSYISRDQLEELLSNDRRVPISDKEYEIICSLFAICGYCYRSLEELGCVYGENDSSIYRRYLRAILTIKKYLNKEIEPMVIYEEDIEPYLKYFSRSDRMFIEDKYKNNLTYEQLSDKYKISYESVIDILYRIDFSLYDIKNNSKANKFDFIFYEENIDNIDIPYYGNKEIAKNVFDLFFAESSIKRLSINEIHDSYYPDISLSTLHNMVFILMISVCKYRDGIKKYDPFTHDDIVDYYNRHKDNMVLIDRRVYEKYFNNYNRKVIKYASIIPYKIVFDLLREKGIYYDLKNKSQEDIIKLLKDYGDIIPKRVKTKLFMMFNMNSRNYMSGKDINHVYRLLYKMYRLKNSKKNDQDKQLILKNNNKD